MRHRFPVLTTLVFVCALGAAEANEVAEHTPQQIIEKSIAYHDPNGAWGTARARLGIHTTYSEEYAERTGSQDAMLTITLAPGHEEFRYVKEAGADKIDIALVRGQANCEVNGSSDVSDEDKKRLRLREPTLYRDYCEYLYGMPMKLRDPGTILDPNVNRTRFNDRDVLQLKVTYDPDVGGDTWYFYFVHETFALVGYRFYHDESQNDGEYITLDDEIVDEASGLRLPKVRAWYYNADDKHLATDDIVSIRTN